MQAERLKILLQLLEEEPNDPFHRYAVAMEYLGKDIDEALKHLNILLAEHPDYLATYYQAAMLYAEREDEKEATAIFEKGVAVAEKQRNEKTLKELKGAYNMYKDEWEM